MASLPPPRRPSPRSTPRSRNPRSAALHAVAWLTALQVVLAGALLLDPRPGSAHDSTGREIADASRKIGSDPGNAAEILRRGELYRLERDWDRALADYDRAARLDPALHEVDLCRGALELDRGRPAPARAALDRFLAGAPD